MQAKKMTRRQHDVFTYLLSRCSGRREVRCSVGRIAERFQLSEGQAARVLGRLEEGEFLEILRRGTGRRPHVYRLSHVNLSSIVVTRRKNTPRAEPKEGQVVQFPHRRTARVFDLSERDPIISKDNKTKNNNNYARDVRAGATTGLRVLSTIPKFVPKIKSTPLTRFAERSRTPTKWTNQDFVCYFSLLYSHEFGTEPILDWGRDTHAAGVLIRKFRDLVDGDPKIAVKHYLQICFATLRRGFKPYSISVFLQARNINDAKDRWEDPDILHDYRDKVILKPLAAKTA